MGFGPLPGGGATIPSTTDLIKGDGAGNGADSGLAATVSGGGVTFSKSIEGTVIGSITPATGAFTMVNLGPCALQNSSVFLSVGNGVLINFTTPGIATGGFSSDIPINNGVQILGHLGSIFQTNQSAPSTPTGGAILYCTAGQLHALDANAVDINVSQCPQRDTGWTPNADAGDKTSVIPSNGTVSGIASALNLLVSGAGDLLAATAQKVKAIENALSQTSPSLYPNQ